MLEFVRGFFTTEAIFERVVRSALILAGVVMATGAELTDWGAWVVALGGMVKAGDKNPGN